MEAEPLHAETTASAPAEHPEPQPVFAPAPPEATEEPDWYNPPAQVIEKLGESEPPTITEHPTSEAPLSEPRPEHEEPGSEHEH